MSVQSQKSDCEKRKAHKMSLNWCLEHHTHRIVSHELIKCINGNCYTGEVSRLAKRELFTCFVSLWDSLAPRAIKREARRSIGGKDASSYPYNKVKALAGDYQAAKCRVADHFSKKPYGSRWLKMPKEVDCFSLQKENEGSDSDI